jgi:imidazolonepropionase-like amidohydrolase
MRVNEPLVVTAGRVLTAPDEPVIPDGAVLVATDGTIAAVGPRPEVLARAAPGARRVDHPGATLLPGLINCHVHLAFDAGEDPVASLRAADDVDLVLAMAGRARRLLDVGVTTVRDLGDRGSLALRLRDAVADGRLPGPRVLTSGAPLTVEGGHCWFLGGEVGDGASIRAAVEQRAELGVDVVKVMVSGGHLTPGGPAMWDAQFSRERLARVVEAARGVGLPVAAHAHGTASMADCAAVGVDTIEHGTWLSGRARDLRYDTPDWLAERIAAAGIAVCPARSRNWRTFRGLDELLGRLAWMDGHGIRIVAGTDSGVPGSVFDDFVTSLGLYAAAGWSPARLLAMATTEAAAAVGLADRVGRLRVGFDADLVVVSGDPLARIEALSDVRLVVARGIEQRPA